MAERVHVPALDGVRGTAFILVFLLHYAGGAQSANPMLRLEGEITRAGWTGVSLFFVLSGFLITGILWDTIGLKHWWRNFYIRRTLRIFPLYYFSLLLVLGAAVLAGVERQSLRGLWVYALYLQNLGTFPDPNALLGRVPLKLSHLWSLAAEEQFYIAWPWMLYMVRGQRRTAKWMCWAIFLMSFSYRAAMAHYACDPMVFWGTTFARAGEFAAGGWLALTIRGPEGERERVLKLAAPTAVLALAAFCVFDAVHGTPANVSNYVWGVTLTAPLFAALIALSLGKNPVQRVMQMRWLRQVGVISYGLYVYHVLFADEFAAVASRLTAMAHGGRNAGLGIRFAVAAAMTYGLAEISYRLMEKPFLRLKNRWARTPKAA